MVKPLEGIVTVCDYDARGRSPDEVAIIEKARSYGAHSVFFEAERNGRSPVPQAFVFIAPGPDEDEEFAAVHKRLWSWGGVPLAYRASPGRIQLFRCAHGPDFVGIDGQPVCNPVKTLLIGTKIASADIWWDAARLRNGTLWDVPDACELMLSAKKSAHRKLVEEVRGLNALLAKKRLLEDSLRRRLLILSLLIAYLEERSVLQPDDFGAAHPGAERFFQVLANGPALVSLLNSLEDRFNGNIFALTVSQRQTLLNSPDLSQFSRLIEGFEDSSGQLSLWRLYSFRDLPVELISNIYQLFVNDSKVSVYTPPALVRLILEEALSWERLDTLMAGEGVILDPACGSGVFLVEAYKRLVLHWRFRNGWSRPGTEDLRLLLLRVRGIDVEEGAIELAAFSLCLSLCDALEPEEIRCSIKLFPQLAGQTLHRGCFFEAMEQRLVRAPICAIVGNPPFTSNMPTHGARRSLAAYKAAHGALGDQQLAYLFLHASMEALESGGMLAMIEPAGLLYNRHAQAFRRTLLSRWRVREILDFVSVPGIFSKGQAKVVVVVAEAIPPPPDSRLLHAVFRRNGRSNAEQGFDIDYYDLHWFRNLDAACSIDIWRSNLLGGSRVRAFIERLRRYPTLRQYAENRAWNYGEGFIAGSKGKAGQSDDLVGKPLLPTSAFTRKGLDASRLTVVPEGPIERKRSNEIFTPPMLLIKEHETIPSAVWRKHFLAYRHKILGIAAPESDADRLEAVKSWLDRESVLLQAYLAGISASLFTQRATHVLANDLLTLPYLEGGSLDASDNERIIAQDIVDRQRDFIRGTEYVMMQTVSPVQLRQFDEVFTTQINASYPKNPVRVLQLQRWSGALCQVFAFGKGATVDWSDAEQLQGKLDSLLRDRRAGGLTVTRIARVYEQEFLFLLKPDIYRFWTRSIALRDADDVLADLRHQGF